MPSIVLYLLKCSISLAIVWLFYRLLLRRLTFYAINRWYLLGYALLSFLLPLVHIVLPDEGVAGGKVQLMHFIPVVAIHPAVDTEVSLLTGWNILLGVVALGALFLTGQFLIRWLSLRRIRKEAILTRDGEVRIYQVDKPIIPFSFGSAIYINTSLHSDKECKEIILHEYVHVRQRHTVDILLAELLCIVNWWNPFSWLIRHSIRQNLEFIADAQVLASGLDRKSYQYHLLKVVGEPCYRLANNFNFSSLKKRIVMMNRSKSGPIHLVKLLFIVPVLGVLLVAFRDNVNIRIGMPIAVSKTDTTPVKSPEVILRKVIVSDTARPLIVIDEVEAPGGLKKVNSNDIESVNVLKAAPVFGAAGANGVVLVYTKHYIKKNKIRMKDGKVVTIVVDKEGPPVMILDTLRVKDVTIDSLHVGNDVYTGSITDVNIGEPAKAAGPQKDPLAELRKCLFLVDGMESTYEEAFKIKGDRIESINIIKDVTAVKLYGKKAEFGVVNIKTKATGYKGQTSFILVDKGDTVKMRADSIHIDPSAQRK